MLTSRFSVQIIGYRLIILVCGPFDGEKKKILQDIAVENEIIFMDKEAVTTDIIRNVDSVIGNISIEILKCNQNLEWVRPRWENGC